MVQGTVFKERHRTFSERVVGLLLLYLGCFVVRALLNTKFSFPNSPFACIGYALLIVHPSALLYAGLRMAFYDYGTRVDLATGQVVRWKAFGPLVRATYRSLAGFDEVSISGYEIGGKFSTRTRYEVELKSGREAMTVSDRQYTFLEGWTLGERLVAAAAAAGHPGLRLPPAPPDLDRRRPYVWRKTKKP